MERYSPEATFVWEFLLLERGSAIWTGCCLADVRLLWTEQVQLLKFWLSDSVWDAMMQPSTAPQYVKTFANRPGTSAEHGQ
jgi:hypothetical protein